MDDLYVAGSLFNVASTFVDETWHRLVTHMPAPVVQNNIFDVELPENEFQAPM